MTGQLYLFFSTPIVREIHTGIIRCRNMRKFLDAVIATWQYWLLYGWTVCSVAAAMLAALTSRGGARPPSAANDAFPCATAASGSLRSSTSSSLTRDHLDAEGGGSAASDEPPNVRVPPQVTAQYRYDSETDRFVRSPAPSTTSCGPQDALGLVAAVKGDRRIDEEPTSHGVTFRLARHLARLLGLTRPDPRVAELPTTMTIREVSHRMRAATTFAEWRAAARLLDESEGFADWRLEEDPDNRLFHFDEVLHRIRKLYDLRSTRRFHSLLQVLQTDFHRDMCGISNPLLYQYRTGTKAAVSVYVQLVARLIREVGNMASHSGRHGHQQQPPQHQSDEAPLPLKGGVAQNVTVADEASSSAKCPFSIAKGEASARPPLASRDTLVEGILGSPVHHADATHSSAVGNGSSSHASGGVTTSELHHQRQHALSNISRAYGHTALILNSSAILGAYHLGVVKALNDAGLLPRVIFGRSTGAIVAAFVCCSGDVDAQISLKTVDFTAFTKRSGGGGSGWRKLTRLFTRGTLMDVDVLLKFVQDNLGPVTFLEAYQRTGCVLNIYVSKEVTPGRDTGWLMNYLTAPHVLVASAAVASCWTPGLYASVPLMCKSLDGSVHELQPHSLRFLPRSSIRTFHVNRATERLRELFNIRTFIVADASLSHLPFLSLEEWSHPIAKIVRFFSEEVWRGLAFLTRQPWCLSRLTPQLQAAIEPITGDVIIHPVTGVRDILRLLSNPDANLLKHCVWRGESQVWPKLPFIHTVMVIEKALERATGRWTAGNGEPGGNVAGADDTAVKFAPGRSRRMIVADLEHYEF